jgi:hypothetical protein
MIETGSLMSNLKEVGSYIIYIITQFYFQLKTALLISELIN